MCVCVCVILVTDISGSNGRRQVWFALKKTENNPLS